MSYNLYFNKELLHRFIELITINTGWYIREQDRKNLCQKIEARIKSLKLSGPETYYQLLEANTEQSHNEWRQLALLLTTIETYLFRDQGQFSLLRNYILPQLIEQKRKESYSNGATKPSLRLWSAGCSTGEEPYSLAVLVKELIPEWQDWDIFILGTDINLEALEKAQQGIYSSWSFRLVDAEVQKRYFQPWKDSWKLDEKIRQMVTFQYGNLVKDLYPSNSNAIYNMDLIICRNVFVYFDNNSISVVLKKFTNTLSSVGYLLTGHAELYGQDLSFLQSKVFPESVVYQRRESLSNAIYVPDRSPSVSPGGAPTAYGNGYKTKPLPQVSESLGEVLLPPPAQPKSDFNNFALSKKESLSPPLSGGINYSSINSANLAKGKFQQAKSLEATYSKLLGEAETLFKNKAYYEAIKKAEQALALQPRSFNVYYLLAQIHANLGNYNKARQYCHQALSVDSLTILPYYTLAHIAEEQGDIEAAKRFLKKIIYLVPSSISAYLELGSLYQKEGDVTRSLKMRSVALDLLSELPANATVEQQGGITVAQLMTRLKTILSNSQ